MGGVLRRLGIMTKGKGAGASPPPAAGGGKPIGRPIKRDNLTADPPFTATSLREVLAAAGNKYVMPSDAELSELTSILNFWHGHFYHAQEAQKINELKSKAAEAFRILKEVIPQIAAELLQQYNVLHSARRHDFFISIQLKDATEVSSILHENNLGFLQLDDFPNFAKDWRWLIEVLPKDIEAAMRPANPNWPTGHSSRGPLAKILAGVVHRVSGDRVTAAAISTQINAARPSKLSTAEK